MNTVYIISHTHWDREWYRTFQQFRLRLVHLMDNLLYILGSDPEFLHFMLDGQTIVLNDYLEIRPEKEDLLRQHIQSGRLLIGPWYILPDEFLVSPEATIRNLLEGDRICKHWGTKMNLGYAPDTFGHIGQMPQILRGFGMDTACLWRGVGDRPCELWWQAPDGSRVLLAFLRDSYSNGAGLPTDDPQAFSAELNRVCKDLIPHTSIPHLLVMLGTDHMEPSPNTSTVIRHANQALEGFQVRHATLPDYLAAMQSAIDRDAIPVVFGELRSSQRAHLLPGVLSTRMWIKQRNRSCETLLERWVEPFSAWSSLVCGEAYQTQPFYQAQERLADPTALIRHAWRLLMQNHPHDSICGCSIDQVHEEMRIRFDQVEQIGEEIIQHSLTGLSAAVATEAIPAVVGQARLALVVFNAAPCPQTALVRTSLVLPKDITDFELVDAAGNPLPYLLAGRETTTLFNFNMPAEDFKNSLKMVKDGKVMNFGIRSMTVERRGDHAEVFMVMDVNGEADVEAYRRGAEEIQQALTDPAVKTFHVVAQSADAVEVIFLAQNIPAMGYATCWLRKIQPAQPPSIKVNWLARWLMPVIARLSQIPWIRRRLARPQQPKSTLPYVIENQYYRIEASADDGTLTLLDKRFGHQYSRLNRFVDGGDCGDEYNYSPPACDQLIQETRLLRAAVEQSPLGATLTLHLELEVPTALAADRQKRSSETVKLPICTQVRLLPEAERVEIHTEIENTAQDHRLRVHFPAPFKVDRAYHDGHFEIVERSIGVTAWDETWAEQPRPEVPQRTFTALRNESQGLMIANRGLPEVEARHLGEGGSEIALTLLRCVGWLSRDDFSTRRGHAGPFLPTPGAQMAGKYAFDYAILPFGAGEDQFLAACHQAFAFQTSLRVLSEPLHAGALPVTASMIECSNPKFLISAIKAAQVENQPPEAHWIGRGYNLTGEPIEVELRPWRKPAGANLVNLAEIPQSALNLREDGSIRLIVGPHQIQTIEWIHTYSDAPQNPKRQ